MSDQILDPKRPCVDPVTGPVLSFDVLPPRLIISHILSHRRVVIAPDTRPNPPKCPHAENKYDREPYACENCASTLEYTEKLQRWCEWTFSGYRIVIPRYNNCSKYIILDERWDGDLSMYELHPMSLFGRFKRDPLRHPWFLFRRLWLGHWEPRKFDIEDAADLLRSVLVFSPRKLVELQVSESVIQELGIVAEFESLTSLHWVAETTVLRYWEPKCPRLEEVHLEFEGEDDAGTWSNFTQPLAVNFDGARFSGIRKLSLQLQQSPDLSSYFSSDKLCSNLRRLSISGTFESSMPCESLCNLVKFKFCDYHGGISSLAKEVLMRILNQSALTLEAIRLDNIAGYREDVDSDLVLVISGHFPVLRVLHLSGTQTDRLIVPSLVKFQSGGTRLLARSPRFGNALEKLSLSHCQIALDSSLFDSRPVDLYLSECKEVGSGEPITLSQFNVTELKKLYLSDCPIKRPLPIFPKLESLEAQTTKLLASDLEDSRFPTLKSLTLRICLEPFSLSSVEQLEVLNESPNFALILQSADDMIYFPSLKCLCADLGSDLNESVIQFFLSELKSEPHYIPPSLERLVVRGMEDSLVWDRTKGLSFRDIPQFVRYFDFWAKSDFSEQPLMLQLRELLLARFG